MSGSNFGDNLRGNAGSNTIWGENGNDSIYGRDGNDVLNGGLGGDWLYGGNGNDRLVGGTSRDTLVGGAGDDVFEFRSTAKSTGLGADIIVGFDAPGDWIAPGQGDIDTDRIDVSGIDANTGVAGNQSFRFIGEATAVEAFAEGTGVIWVENAGTETNVYGNVDGDAFAELRIRNPGRADRCRDLQFRRLHRCVEPFLLSFRVRHRVQCGGSRP